MGRVTVLGLFMADTSYRTGRLPRLGETVMGESFTLGPGGKGSNQAVAAARAGATVTMLSRLGADTFGAMARTLWSEAGITDRAVEDPDAATGTANIVVETASGNNTIIVVPGAGGEIGPADVEGWADAIAEADVFVTQLEQPIPAALAGLHAARSAGTVTVLNPAPAATLPEGMLAACDFVTPNETEAELLTGIAVDGPVAAERAGAALIAAGAGTALVTLGAGGVVVHDGRRARHLPAPVPPAPVRDTTGAGDAFTGAFAAGLADGKSVEDAVAFAQAAAGLSVTRVGAAASMADLAEITAFLDNRRPS